MYFNSLCIWLWISEKSSKQVRSLYTGKALGKHVINLYSAGISQWVKIKDVKKLHQDIEDDPITKDQMAVLGCLLLCTFGDYLTPVLASVLITAHTLNNLDPGDESENKNEGYERKKLSRCTLWPSPRPHLASMV